MSHHEKMSHVDTAWLRMDRATNLMQIVGLMLFDGVLDNDRLRRVIEERLLRFDRFRQVVRHIGVGYAWADDPDFDLNHHLRRGVLPAPAGKRELEHFVADLVSTPLNPSRPLWEMHVVDTSLGGQALVLRIHHSIGDGIALVDVTLSMADDFEPSPQAGVASHQAERLHAPHHDDDDHFWGALWRPLSHSMAASMHASASLWARCIKLAANPWQSYEYARLGSTLAAEAAKLLAMPSDSATRLKGKPGTTKRVAWSEPLSLPDVKAVGRVLGCSINDLLLSSVAGALRAYLAECGDATHGVEIRAQVPMNLRQPKDTGKLGNQFGLVSLELPVGIENPLARLYETQKRMHRLKHSVQGPLTFILLSAAGMAPRLAQEQLLDFLARKSTAVMSNVPGPQKPLRIAGAQLRQPLFWVPQSGDIGMGVSILSYNGHVQFGLITDKRLVPEPQRIVARFAQEFEKLLMLVLLHPGDCLADPDRIEVHLARTTTRPRRAARNGNGNGNGNGADQSAANSALADSTSSRSMASAALH